MRMFKVHKHMVYILHSCRDCYWNVCFQFNSSSDVPNRFKIWRDRCFNKYYLWTLRGWKEHGTALILWRDWKIMKQIWSSVRIVYEQIWSQEGVKEYGTDLTLERDCCFKFQQWIRMRRDCSWKDLNIC